jgi:2-oxoglutarate ferredoxin oxidoreductase subunit alpha
MSETISMGANLEIPCVFCDVQRNGPGTGYVTEPHHNDIGFSRFPGNGEFEVIALAPMSCQELFDLTITAFNYAEKYRCPVFLMSDAYLGHLHEVVNIPPKEEIEKRVIKREIPEEFPDKPATFTQKDRKTGEYNIPKPVKVGSDYCPGVLVHQPHGPTGLPTPKPMEFIKMMIDKIRSKKDEIVITDSYKLDDAEIVIIAYGLPVRSSFHAVDLARKEGIKVGVFRLVTVWPFPDEKVKEVVKDVKAVIVPELNYTGVIAEQIERVTDLSIPVKKLPKVCEFPTPQDILKLIKEVAK